MGRRNAPTLTYAAEGPRPSTATPRASAAGCSTTGAPPTSSSRPRAPCSTRPRCRWPTRAAVVAAVRAEATLRGRLRRSLRAGRARRSRAGIQRHRPGDRRLRAYRDLRALRFEVRPLAGGRGGADGSRGAGGGCCSSSQQFTNCALCHLGDGGLRDARGTLHRPPLPQRRYAGASGAAWRRIPGPRREPPPAAGDPRQAGACRTPTLRNVAVTDRYMHNGVFKDCARSCCSTNSWNTPPRRGGFNPEMRGRPRPRPAL